MSRNPVLVLIAMFALTGGSATRVLAVTCPNAGPFCIDGNVYNPDGSSDTFSGLAPGALRTNDPNGNNKELGPINSSTTKIGVINTAPVPMLGDTNPNSQTDLNTVYTQTGKDPSNNHIWFYFGWRRDSNNGSGFISIEAERAVGGGAANPCDYTSPATLINCNPWAGRAAGDFLLLWDQSGNSTNIYLRTWDGSVFQPDPKSVVPLSSDLATAAYTSDLFGGEAAIDLTGLNLLPPGDCNLFANVIPGTVTGNSDTADDKDVVLAPISIQPCGAFKVTKVTLAPDGVTHLADLTTTFSFSVTKGGNAYATNVSIKDGQTVTYNDAPTATDYVLTENTASFPPAYDSAKIAIACDNPANSTGTFTVVQSQTTSCTIYNTHIPGAPSASSIQLVRVFDAISIKGILVGGSNLTGKNRLQAVVGLYTDNTCGTLVSPTAPAGNPQTFGLTATLDQTELDGDFQLVAGGINVTKNSTLWWGFDWPGDTFNSTLTHVQTCTEAVGISFTPVQ